MDKVIVFSERLELGRIEGVEIISAGSIEDVARSLVQGENIRSLIVDADSFEDDYHPFLLSVKNNMPLLDAALITERSSEKIRGYNIFEKKADDNTLVSEITDFIKRSENRNKRDSNRFCWPLSADFSSDNQQWDRLEIYSVSSGGAYLMSRSVFPTAGINGEVSIQFCNFSLRSSCVVVESFSRSSNYPPGFGIRFTSLSDEARKKLDILIDDAVIKILMDPESEPEVPSLESEELLPDFTFI